MFTGQGQWDEDRSAPATTYLTVQPSPLVASLVTSETDYQRSDTVNLNLTGSHDPDVVATNKSGIRLQVFCYPQAVADIYESLSVDQLHSSAYSIVNNRSDHHTH